MTTQHTPGPWHAMPFGCDAVTGMQGESIYGQDNYRVAEILFSSLREYEQHKANARLIASAPALLIALKELRSYADLKLLQHRQDYPEEHCMVQTAIRMIAAADKAIADAQSNP